MITMTIIANKKLNQATDRLNLQKIKTTRGSYSFFLLLLVTNKTKLFLALITLMISKFSSVKEMYWRLINFTWTQTECVNC